MAHEGANDTRIAEVPPQEFRRRDLVAWCRLWLPIVAIGVWLVYCLTGTISGDSTRYTPGPLAHVHAMWDLDCAACHDGMRPLGGNNWLAAATGMTHVADATCQSCHAGPEHHQNQKLADVPGCVSCHREHRGRAHELTRSPDRNCTSCHADLAAHLAQGKTTSYQNVTAFAEGQHPEFRWLREQAQDPGRIAFNHALHLMPGLRAKADTAAALVLGDVPAEFRERYRRTGQGDKAPVQLDCASCHVLDASKQPPVPAGLPGALVPARPAGATMLPIVFEQHCQACHPLTFARREAGASAAPAVRHRLQPAEIRTWLRGYFTEKLLLGKFEFLEQPLPRPLPGKKPAVDVQAGQKAGELLAHEIGKAEAILYGPSTCQKCHVDLEASKGTSQRIEGVQIPQVWYTSARFDHTAHRAADCRLCHPGAYPLNPDGTSNAAASKSARDVLLPGIHTCLECHSPQTGAGAQAAGGARHDCAECHRYHAGAHPLHGRGTLLRNPPGGPLPTWRRLLDPPDR